MNMQFITFLAWIFGVLSAILVILRLFGMATYSESEKLMDMVNGLERSFPIVKPMIMVVICFAWIATN